MGMASFSIERNGDGMQVSVTGKPSADGIAGLRSTMQRAMEAGSKTIAFDLSALDALDSAFLKLLLAAGNSLEPTGGSIALRNANPSIRHILSVLGLDERLPSKPGLTEP